jgi:hypothetical protein
LEIYPKTKPLQPEIAEIPNFEVFHARECLVLAKVRRRRARVEGPF